MVSGPLGCDSGERVSHDLAALYPEAVVRRDTAAIDFGAEDARPSFLSGFSANENTGDGVSFVWSDGDISELRLFLIEPRALTLSFRCWPFGFAGAPLQTVSVSLNGEEVSSVELAPGPGEYHVAVPAGLQLSGDNVLRLRYGYDRAPSDVIAGAHDDRRLGVGWDWLRLDGALPSESPVAGAEGIRVPLGSRIDYFVVALPRSRFTAEALRSEEGGGLTVTAETVSTQVVRRFEARSRARDLELALSGGLVRLSLQASSAEVVVQRPRIVTSASEPRRARNLVEASKRRPNIIVYLIDTLRADHLSSYGYSKSTPRIDALAADGTLFEHALAQASWTKPATASILTGLHPRAHTANQREDALPAEVRMVPEELKALGYETAALVVNANVSAPFGFDRGFDTFELLLHEDGILGARGDQLVDRAVEWLGSRRSQEPFFLYLHTTDPHDPYATTGFHTDGFGSVAFMESLEEGRATLSPGELARLVDLYDEDVAFADAQLGRFVDALKAHGLYEDALIVLLSDHGEEFDDHGRWRHGKTLYHEQLRVPLIIKWPTGVGAGERIGELAQHVDIVPTLLDYVGGPRNPAMQGRSLWPLVAGEPSLVTPPLPSVATSYLLVDGREIESVVLGDHKLIRYLDYDRDVAPYQLFDLGSDAAETANVARENARLAAFLTDYLRHASPQPAALPTPAAIDENVERQLRALGYVR